MNLTVIGTGYVGLVTGTCFAEMGNTVTCVDTDPAKVANLKQGQIPIFEPGLDVLVKNNVKEGRLRFTTSLAEAMIDSRVYFIAVGTPSNGDGSADLSQVLGVAGEIGQHLTEYGVVVDKSTVPVGTAEKVRAVIESELQKRGQNIAFDVVSNPEFLKEGAAIEDFMRPDRIIVGTESDRARDIMRQLYAPFNMNRDRTIYMGVRDAEMTKYAANAMLATRISFVNELSRLCEEVGADIDQVRRGIGSDRRIGMPFLYAGLGYGGSCFPKDVKALVHMFRQHGLPPQILAAVEAVNTGQRRRFIDGILRHYRNAVAGKTFAVWGLAFKPQTDDMREAPAIDIIGTLRRKGARFRVHDPVAMETAAAVLGGRGIEYQADAYEALRGADALLLLTEWHQFREPDFARMRRLLKRPVVFDGRNQYDPAQLRKLGFTYRCVGRA